MGKKRRRQAPNGRPPSNSVLSQRVQIVLGALEAEGAAMTSESAYSMLVSRYAEYQLRSEAGLKALISAAIVKWRTPVSEGKDESVANDVEVKDAAPDEDEVLDLEDKHNLLNAGLYQGSRKKHKKEKEARPRSTAQTQGSKFLKVQASRPKERFADMGGIDACIKDIMELCGYPLAHPELYEHLGVEPPRGILLHGPPGSGKTMLARAIAGELGVAFFGISAPEVVSGMSGESEEKLRNLFEEAKAKAPAIIFIDEIDAITGKRESSSRGMERRIVAQLLTCMDSLKDSEEGENASPETVLVIGATNRPDSLDAALRRAGRFDREISMGIPNLKARENILRCISAKMRLSGDFDFTEIARLTPGFVGADLNALAKEAAVIAVNRVFSKMMEVNQLHRNGEPFTKEQLVGISIEMSDFLAAVNKVQPSAKREGFATVPSVTWDDIGSLANVREELSMAITEPIRHPERFKAMGLTAPMGVLLYGPPGCGKTLTAKAIASSSGSNFISVKGPELLNKYVGESERAVRQVFARARSSVPCVVFFDELDALCPRRGSDGSNGVSERVVNQLLTEMDGLEERREVFVIAATNRPDIIDPAILRPGRLDKMLYVPLPTAQDRVSILETCARKTPLAQDVDLAAIAKSNRLERFSGADLNSLVQEAALQALRRSCEVVEANPKVTLLDFEVAMQKVKPSISKVDEKLYAELKDNIDDMMT